MMMIAVLPVYNNSFVSTHDPIELKCPRTCEDSPLRAVWDDVSALVPPHSRTRSAAGIDPSFVDTRKAVPSGRLNAMPTHR